MSKHARRPSRRPLAAVVAALTAAIGAAAAFAATAQAQDLPKPIGWTSNLQLSTDSACVAEGTETVPITVHNPQPKEHEGKPVDDLWFTLKGPDFYKGSQHLASGASKSYDVPYVPGGTYRIGNTGKGPAVEVSLPDVCQDDPGDGGDNGDGDNGDGGDTGDTGDSADDQGDDSADDNGQDDGADTDQGGSAPVPTPVETEHAVTG